MIRSRTHALTLGAGLTGLVLAAVVTAGATPAAADATIGPVFPAPGSGTWSSTGSDVAAAGGITWTYTGVDPTQFGQMVWGLGYPQFPSTFSFGLDTATLSFDPATSNLAGGVLNFTGTAEFPNLDGSTPSYPIQLTVTALTGPTTSFTDPGSLTGLTVDPSAGGVLPVTGDFSVNLIMQVSTDSGTTWTPADDYFNNTPHTSGVSTSSSVDGDFWYTPAQPAVSFGQNPLAFGSQPVGSTTDLTEIVTNTGSGPLNITEIDAGGDYSAPSDTCVGNQVDPGDTCSIDVEFSPSAGGTDNGSLVLTDNAPDSPQTLPLTGAGDQAQAVLSPSPVDFGTVSLGSSGQQTLTVSNPGTATLDLTNAQLGGADPGDFQLTGLGSGCVGQPPTVAAGTSCGVQITFTPGGTGTRTATLTLSDNASPPTQSVTLTGVGAAPTADAAVFLSPSRYKVRAGTQLTYSVVVDNFGPNAAASVVLTDALPHSATFVSSSGGTCNTPPVGYTGKISCSLGTVPAMSAQTFTFVVKLHAKAGAKVLDMAKVTTASDDPVKANNSATTAVKMKS